MLLSVLRSACSKFDWSHSGFCEYPILANVSKIVYNLGRTLPEAASVYIVEIFLKSLLLWRLKKFDSSDSK